MHIAERQIGVRDLRREDVRHAVRVAHDLDRRPEALDLDASFRLRQRGAKPQAAGPAGKRENGQQAEAGGGEEAKCPGHARSWVVGRAAILDGGGRRGL